MILQKQVKSLFSLFKIYQRKMHLFDWKKTSTKETISNEDWIYYLSLTHKPHKCPPYGLETLLLCWEISLYPVGLRVGTPVRGFLQVGQLGREALFFMCWATNLPPAKVKNESQMLKMTWSSDGSDFVGSGVPRSGSSVGNSRCHVLKENDFINLYLFSSRNLIC